MVNDAALSELLSLWQQEQAGGRDVPAAELCRDRPELTDELARRIEVLRRLDGVASPGEVGSTPAPLPTAASADPWQTRVNGTDSQATLLPPVAGQSADLPPPAPLPGYEILGRLGEGGMGVVYRARQLRPARLVALKMIRAGGDREPEQLDRFRREAEALARLQHPNIVPVYEVGEHDGRPFFCMELQEGGSLDRKLAGNPLPPREAAALVEVLAGAVGAAHAKGIVHRDLKPGNVLLTADGAPKISDFGLAKWLDGAAAPTVTGAVLGTPSYMAPEQADGSAKDITPATDVYALGAVLYELLTGRPPFKGASQLDTLYLVKMRAPVGPRQFQPNMPRDLEAVCLKCLEKYPPRRYPSAAALAEDLRRFLDGQPTKARPVGPLGRAWRWSRHRPVVAGLLALLLAVVISGVTGLTALYLRAEAQWDRAEREKANAEAAAAKARRSEEDALQRADAEAKARRSYRSALLAFRESDPLGFLGGYGSSGSPSTRNNPIVRSFLDTTAPELLRDPPDNPADKAALFETVGDLYRSFGDLNLAALLLEESRALRQKPPGEETREYADSLHSLAWLYHDQGRYTEAEELYKKALDLRQRLSDARGVDATQFNLAWLLTQMGDYAQAEKLFLQVIAGRRSREGDASRHTAIAKAALAALYLDRGEPLKAVEWSKQAIETLITLDGNQGLWRAAALFQQALIAENLLGTDPVPKLKESLEMGYHSLGQDHPYNALVMHEVARSLEKRGDLTGAELYYNECLRVTRVAVTLGHPKAAVAVRSLAELLGRTRRAAQADALFDELLAAHRKRFGAEHFLVADAMVEYANALGDRGEEKRQKAKLSEALAIYRKGDKRHGRLYSSCLNGLGLIALHDKDYAGAERLFNEALPLVRRQYGSSHPNLAWVLVNLASAKIHQGQTPGVKELLSEAEKISKTTLPFDPQLAEDIRQLLDRLRAKPEDTSPKRPSPVP